MGVLPMRYFAKRLSIAMMSGSGYPATRPGEKSRRSCASARGANAVAARKERLCMWRYSISMTPVVQSAPQLTAKEAERLARDVYGIDAAAAPLPSERDQNFVLRSGAGRFVLKVANA